MVCAPLSFPQLFQLPFLSLHRLLALPSLHCLTTLPLFLLSFSILSLPLISVPHSREDAHDIAVHNWDLLVECNRSDRPGSVSADAWECEEKRERARDLSCIPLHHWIERMCEAKNARVRVRMRGRDRKMRLGWPGDLFWQHREAVWHVGSILNPPIT